jgi:hypothetical protein
MPPMTMTLRVLNVGIHLLEKLAQLAFAGSVTDCVLLILNVRVVSNEMCSV